MAKWDNDARQFATLERGDPLKQRYRFIAIEGIDGSGKRTQLDLLARFLKRRGIKIARFAFPDYHSFFGKMVGNFLDGKFGALKEVNPHFSALLYAGDRLENRGRLLAALDSGKMVITDRYIGSNLAHQTARMPATKRGAFLKWLQKLEYGVYALPKETVVIYLRVPPRAAQGLVAKKAARSYTRKSHDIQEANLRHLRDAASVYDYLARTERNWVCVDCYDAQRARVRTPEDIHSSMVKVLRKRNVLSSEF